MLPSQTKLTSALLTVAFCLPVSSLLAQTHRAVRGNLHPLAQPESDRGPADPTMVLRNVRLVLQRSAAQQAALDQLLEAQQDRHSPQYQRWLTPEQFAGRFGARYQDLSRLVDWPQQEFARCVTRVFAALEPGYYYHLDRDGVRRKEILCAKAVSG